MHKVLKSGFDGGLQVDKPLICLENETLIICQTPYEVRLRGGGTLDDCLCFDLSLVSERAGRLTKVQMWSK